MRGADALIAALEREWVDSVFGIPDADTAAPSRPRAARETIA